MIEIPADVATISVDMSVPSVTHLFMFTKESSTALAQLTYSGDTNADLSSQVDVRCSSPMPAVIDAAVHLRFNKDGGSYDCSDTMLNDAINSGTPYLLTAHHCISDETVALMLTTWFKYSATTCNNGTTGEDNPAYGGADLLYTAHNTVSTLLQLRTSPSVSGVL